MEYYNYSDILDPYIMFIIYFRASWLLHYLSKRAHRHHWILQIFLNLYQHKHHYMVWQSLLYSTF